MEETKNAEMKQNVEASPEVNAPVSESVIPQKILKDLPTAVVAGLKSANDAQKGAFLAEYNRKKKKTLTAELLNIIPIVQLGYLHKWGLQVVFWITGGGAGIWWIVLFFVLPKMVKKYNGDVAVNALQTANLVK